MRVVISASITMPSDSVLHAIAMTPITQQRDVRKRFWSGGRFANTLKNVPSSAAAYGMRE